MKKQVNRVKALQVVMTGEAHETEIPDNLFELFKEIDYENDLKDAEHDINIYILEETEEGYIALISIDSQYLGEVNKYTKKYFTKIESTKSDIEYYGKKYAELIKLCVLTHNFNSDGFVIHGGDLIVHYIAYSDYFEPLSEYHIKKYKDILLRDVEKFNRK